MISTRSYVVGSKIFFIGGRDYEYNWLDEVDSYDVETGEWEQISSTVQMVPARGKYLAVFKGKMLVFK